jgi:pimeloyl-ACP methyl ester carboxylesterase
LIYDYCIIGGGIIGLSTALCLLERQPGVRLLLLEKEQALARHQSGRNSGVIPSGIYCAPGSLKAQLCQLGAIPATALARTIRGVILARPSVYELEFQLRSLTVPTLILIGDEDIPVLRPADFLLACLPLSELTVFRKTDHTLNLEEQAQFNDAVGNFLRSCL